MLRTASAHEISDETELVPTSVFFEGRKSRARVNRGCGNTEDMAFGALPN